MTTIQEWTWIADLAGALSTPLSLLALLVALPFLPDQLEP